jgi:hypothetical protein
MPSPFTPTGLLNWIGRNVDDLVDMGYPREVAERISSGELPMDYESRMARAMKQGYDVDRVFYSGVDHGDNPQITELDRILWSAENPNVANTYGTHMHSGTIYPVYSKAPVATIDANGNRWSNITGIEETPDTFFDTVSRNDGRCL